MNVYLDSSVVLAACGRPTGASRFIIESAPQNGWNLQISGYVLREVERNLRERLPATATTGWNSLAPRLAHVPDILSFDRPVVFERTKDRPVLFTAAAFSEVLLTLDREDFGDIMAAGFYGLAILTPGEFLRRERDAGRLRE